MIRIAIFLLALVAGCSSSVIVDHARAARVISPVLTAARGVIYTTRGAELDACATAPDIRACVNGMSVAALAGSDNEEARDILVPLLGALIELYVGIERALEPWEDAVPLPRFPSLSLTGGE